MKRFLLAPILAVALLTGCATANKPLTKALYVTSVSTGVSFGADRYPTAVPYLRVAAPLLCAAAEGTNLAPAEVVELLQNSPAANAVATVQGKLILNGALSLYIALAESYGGGVTENETLREYLMWTCEAVNLGLPPLTPPAAIAARALDPRRALPPHIK